MCAPCVPGTVLINIADLMQRWTSDQLVSVVRLRLFSADFELSSINRFASSYTVYGLNRPNISGYGEEIEKQMHEKDQTILSNLYVQSS